MPAGPAGDGCGAVRRRSGGGRGRGSPIRPWMPGWAPGPRAALRSSSAEAGAAPHPRHPHPDQSLSRFPLALAPSDTPAGVILRAPSPGAKTTQTPRPTRLFRSQNFSEQVQPGARRSGPAPRPSLTLSRQLTFSVGYTTFPQRAHWGFIVAVPRGGGGAAAAGGSGEPL